MQIFKEISSVVPLKVTESWPPHPQFNSTCHTNKMVVKNRKKSVGKEKEKFFIANYKSFIFLPLAVLRFLVIMKSEITKCYTWKDP